MEILIESLAIVLVSFVSSWYLSVKSLEQKVEPLDIDPERVGNMYVIDSLEDEDKD